MDQREERDWSPATRNRYQAAFSLVFTVGIVNCKIHFNPASFVKRVAEENERVRYLNEKDAGEEERLTAVIREHWPHYLPAFLVSLHTGMRASEQFGLTWSQVSFARRQIHLPKTKAHKARYIPLNAVALGALQELADRHGRAGYVFRNTEGQRLGTGLSPPSRLASWMSTLGTATVTRLLVDW